LAAKTWLKRGDLCGGWVLFAGCFRSSLPFFLLRLVAFALLRPVAFAGIGGQMLSY
jgi:hypothetical protein